MILQSVQAVYENGVLRPLEPLALVEHQQVRVSVAVDSPDLAKVAAEQSRALEELDAELADVPDRSPEDGFTAADHDQLLYGGPA